MSISLSVERISQMSVGLAGRKTEMTVGLRHDDLRRRNRAMVIAAVRRAGQPSRTEIASATGLSHSTISAISSDLIAEGVLEQIKGADAASARRGRPQVALGLAPEAASVAVVVLSLNFLAFTVFDYAGRVAIHREHKVSTLDMGREALLAAVRDGVASILDEATSPVLRLTMAIQGITDAARRKLLWSPITPHGDIDFADMIERATGVATKVENDCNMIAVALQARSQVPAENLIAILLSNGIGMGMMLSGELFTGAYSSGGEFGHMTHVPGGARCRCGREGCIEAYAGNYAILRNALRRDEHEEPMPDIDEPAMQALATTARDHPGPERQAYQRAGEALGYGLGSLFALIDPAPITIVGRGAAAFDLIEPALKAAYARTAGGQHGPDLSFRVELEEAPLIREGGAIRALESLDAGHFAVGMTASLAATA
jgi:predicted NBD/HSP70 family sugar kinase